MSPCSSTPGRAAGALPEQLDTGRQRQLGQQVDRLRGQAQGRTAGGEHPHVVGHRHQPTNEVGGTPYDVLAVVQHQQRGAGAERRGDAGQEVPPAGVGGGAGGAGLPDAEGGGHLGNHVVVRPDAGERHEVDDPLLGPPGHEVREPGLAQPARPHDGGHPRGAEQVGHRRDVGVPAEQRIRLVRHALPDRGRLAAQQVALHGLKCGARVRAQLVAQPPAVRLVPGQRRRRAGGGRLGAQQFGQHLLVPWTLGGQRGERPDRLGVPAEPGQRERPGAHQRAVRGRPFRPQRRQRVDGLGLLGRPGPVREPGLGVSEGRRVVARACPVGGRGGEAAYGGGVHLLLGQGEPVAGGRPLDDVRAELCPGTGDQDL